MERDSKLEEGRKNMIIMVVVVCTFFVCFGGWVLFTLPAQRKIHREYLARQGAETAAAEAAHAAEVAAARAVTGG